MIDIGKYVREARLSAGLTQRALAAQIGISAVFLNQVEKTGKRFPSVYISKLPVEIRTPVLNAAIAELEAIRDA